CHARAALRPVVEPRGRGSGDRPCLPDRPGPAGSGAPPHRRRHAGGSHRRAVGRGARLARRAAGRWGMSAVEFGRTWWGRAWLEALEQRARLDPDRLPRGRDYARSGAVGELLLAPGEARAQVQGRKTAPYEVRIRVRRFTDD